MSTANEVRLALAWTNGRRLAGADRTLCDALGEAYLDLVTVLQTTRGNILSIRATAGEGITTYDKWLAEVDRVLALSSPEPEGQGDLFTEAPE